MLDVEGRHPAVQEFADAFETGHLPPGLPKDVMAKYADLAQALISLLPDGPCLTRALHDLWRSKNEAVLFAVRLGKKGSGA